MAEGYWLSMAAVAAFLGMGWLALSVDAHWRQVMVAQLDKQAAPRGPSLMGALSLAAALFCCLLADHASMAILVWFMLVAASAVSIAMILTWQPQRLRLLGLPWSIGARPVRR